MANKRLFLIVALLFLLASCGSKITPGQKVEAAQESVSGVKTALVQKQKITDEYEASGLTKSKNIAAIAAKVMGTITSMRVEPGQTVKKGQVLVTIESADAQAKVDQAKEGLLAAEKAAGMASEEKTLTATTAGRMGKLYEERAISRQEMDEMQAKQNMTSLKLDQAQADVSRMKAALQEAKNYYGYSTITSPISGIVAYKKADAGTLAVPGTPLLQVEETVYQAETSLDERFWGKIRIGQKLDVSVPSKNYEGRASVVEISPAIDPQTRSFSLKLSMPPSVTGGQYVKVLVPDGERDAVLVPKEAIVSRGELRFVYVINPQHILELRAIRTGKERAGFIEALSGLQGGEHVAVSDLLRLKEGMRVVEAG